MEKNKNIIGAHVSMKAPDYFIGAINETLSYNANALMFYTGPPMNSRRQPLEKFKIEEGLELMAKHDLNPGNIIVHAPYILNCASPEDHKWKFAQEFLVKEIKRCYAMKSKYIVLHPGAHVGSGSEAGISRIVEALDNVLSQDGTDVKIALETMAGKGSEVGRNFQELAEIIKRSKFQERIVVCFDTCHVWDSGLDLNDIDAVLEDFDNVIGLDKLEVIHLNDSKNPLSAHKDRHQNIGKGYIGFPALQKIFDHPKLKSVIKILETPWINKKIPPYKEEILALRNNDESLLPDNSKPE